MGFTRRDFLMRVGLAGGYSAAFLSMQALGITPLRAENGLPLAVAPGTGKGVRVVILGGGISGLVAAYEMKALGYDCTLLEARERPGGRNWSVRGGDKIVFTDGSSQTCEFDPGNYQNVGPARLPSVHSTMLGYCRKFGIPLEVEVNTSRSSFLQNDAANGGKPVVQRQVVNDTRGHVSELLAKCINKGALDEELTKEDRDRMLSFLRIYGSLDEAGRYNGSEGAGYIRQPGAGDENGVLSQPIDMHTLLDENFWDGILFEEAFEMQATMFQPVGGMDRIPYAFAERLGSVIRYGAEVRELRRGPDGGVRILYADQAQGGTVREVTGDFCVCALPPHLLARLPGDLAPATLAALRSGAPDNAGKIGLKFKRRFWEEDDEIYGGRSITNQPISQIYYPFDGLNTKGKGVVIGAYHFSNVKDFDAMTPAQREQAMLEQGAKIHPQYPAEFENSFSVEWQHVRYNEGAWMQYGSEAEQETMFRTLGQPDGPFYFAGDWLTQLVAWQAGAFVSAHRTIAALHARANA